MILTRIDWSLAAHLFAFGSLLTLGVALDSYKNRAPRAPADWPAAGEQRLYDELTGRKAQPKGYGITIDE